MAKSLAGVLLVLCQRTRHVFCLRCVFVLHAFEEVNQIRRTQYFELVFINTFGSACCLLFRPQVLEDSPERHNLTHLHGLAWDRVFISTTSRTSTADGPDQHDLTELLTKCLPSGQAEAKAMAEANALDVDLYDWVRFAARLDVLVWHAGQLAGLSPAPVRFLSDVHACQKEVNSGRTL